MENYKEMYIELMRAVETALETLIEAQRKCEEMYLRCGEGGQDEDEK